MIIALTKASLLGEHVPSWLNEPCRFDPCMTGAMLVAFPHLRRSGPPCW